jgi:nitrite reductase/ring-hydroxylating ferredoxin subunit/uncharacterized membrane protein
MKRDVSERLEQGLIHSGAVKSYAGLLKKPMDALFAKGLLHPLKTFLNGSWLEHPLHPVLIAIPIGAWTVAVLFDLLTLIGRVPNLGQASAIAIGIGALGALAAIITGLMDWMDLDPPELAVGVIHGTVNIIATILFAVSFFMRAGDQWEIDGPVVALSLIGYLVVLFGGFLGGSLVFRRGVMVNRNAYRSEPEEFANAMALNALPENKPTCVDVNGQPVLLMRRGERITAIGAVCSHLGGPLQEGKVGAGNIVCPWHGSQFSLDDGSVRAGPATAPAPFYETRITNGRIQVKLQK